MSRTDLALPESVKGHRNEQRHSVAKPLVPLVQSGFQPVNQQQQSYSYPAQRRPNRNYPSVARSPQGLSGWGPNAQFGFTPPAVQPTGQLPLQPPPTNLEPFNFQQGVVPQQPYTIQDPYTGAGAVGATAPPVGSGLEYGISPQGQPGQFNQPPNQVVPPQLQPSQNYFPAAPQGLQQNLPPGFPQSAPQNFQQPGQPGALFQGGQQGPIMTPANTIDLDVFVPPTTGTGRLKAGGTYGSDNGFVGQLILDERDFNLFRWPRNLREAFGPTAWRGAGQHFRAELVPGDELERYLVSLSFPYFRNTDWSLGLSGYYFDRQFFDWDEQRVGGRVSLGRSLNQFLSVNADLRLEDVDIDNPRLGTSPQLNASLGSHDLYLASIGVTYDSRVQPFQNVEGSYLNLKFTQAFGDFSYSKGEIDFQNHQMIYQRPDFTGRHTIGLRSKVGFTGGDTPVFQNFFGGGSSTLRGFDYRGVSPIEGGVRVGGEFQWFNSLEYMFPLTQDDMIYGTMFVDFGTVEESVELNSENFRVAPGVGLRVNLPFAGLGGAPFNIDFAFPVSTGAGDDEQTVSFFFGFMR